jgi:protein SCO1
MSPRLRFTLLAAVAAAVAFVLLVALNRPAGRSRAVLSSPSSRSVPASSGFDGAALPADVRAHDFTLSDQDGQPISLGRYRGQVLVLAFLDSSCGACILIAQQIRGALDELPRPVPVLIMSVDPHADTPSHVSRFLSRVSLSGRVHYLTGPISQLRPLWRSYGAAPASSTHAVLDGSAAVVLIDPRGLQRVVFPIEELTPESLLHDIRRLQSER